MIAGGSGAGLAAASGAAALPELERVHWRPLVDEDRLARAGRLWTLSALAHVTPFVGAAVALAFVNLLLLPVSLVLLVHAWAIPELYAARGAGVLRPRRRRPRRARRGTSASHLAQCEVNRHSSEDVADGETEDVADGEAERVAVGLLGDLVGHRARELHRCTGLVPERGRLGAWLVGERGAVLVRPGGRRAFCYCVGVREVELPSGDRIAHLLLALREDERGFATVANLAFAGAPWRLRRRLPPRAREALAECVRLARTSP